MISFPLAGPAGEPVSLAQAKAALRVDDEAEDGFIATLIGAARRHLEAVSGLALLSQSWRVVLDAWPKDRRVILPRRPLIALLAVTLYCDDGEPHLLDLDDVRTEPGRLILPRGPSEGVALQARGGIEIDFSAGFGTTADAVPADLSAAMLVLIGHWFEHRAAVFAAGAGAVVPSGFDRLLAPYREVRL